jgi:hypothetical protein
METQYKTGHPNTSNRSQDPLETEGGAKTKQNKG